MAILKLVPTDAPIGKKGKKGEDEASADEKADVAPHLIRLSLWLQVALQALAVAVVNLVGDLSLATAALLLVWGATVAVSGARKRV